MDAILLPITARRYNEVIAAVEHASKWLQVIPVKDKLAETIASVLQNQILPKLPRVPNGILSDNGSEFKNEKVNSVLDSFNMGHIYSTPYKTSSNGYVERWNRNIIELLKGK